VRDDTDPFARLRRPRCGANRFRHCSHEPHSWKAGARLCDHLKGYRTVIAEEILAKVAADRAYQNAKQNSDKQNAPIEHDKAFQRVMTDLLAEHTELFRQFSDNLSFRRWLADSIFALVYD
jgi:hypothetical protein